MKHCLKEVQGRIEFTTEYKGKTAKDIRERMDEIMDARGEGLVIKHPMSKYVLNGRNVDWIKVRGFSCFLGCIDARTPIGQARIYGKYEGTTLTSSHGAIMQDNLGETVDVLVVGELLCLSLPAIFLIVLP